MAERVEQRTTYSPVPGAAGENARVPVSGADSNAGLVQAPTISLPKGGGAIRGIGEKFAANPVTGTGSLTVPIYVSPGRSGFGPQLSLSYDSGAGNGPFGFGWSLSLPSITRKTDKGLPQYDDTEESDVFILSSAEDLVPVLNRTVDNNGNEKWNRDISQRSMYGAEYEVRRYRPRIEGLFARIERWRNLSDPQDTFWRSISKDNITTWYGRTAESRIADPADPARIFTWLICESYDDRGNVISYRYKKEDSAGVDTSQAHERNRSVQGRSANRYLKYIFYGNRTPYFPDLNGAAAVSLPKDWCFELVFDYGEHDDKAPVPEETGKEWDCRADPFSAYRATFEVRTYRLCRRTLMFHQFEHQSDVGLDCLVRSTDFAYTKVPQQPDPTKPFYSFLAAVTQTGYRRSADGSYLAKAMPPLAFSYTEATVDETVRDVEPESLQNLPYGLDGSDYQWVDLDGEGLSGILTEQGGSWFYKRNLSAANTRVDNGREMTLARFAPVEVIARQPSLAALSGGRQQLLDLAGNGQLDLVDFGGPSPGFFKRSEDEDWEPYRPFASLPAIDWGDPNLKFVDVTGDGHADVLISEDQVFRWHGSLAEAGFGPEQTTPQAFDEEKGPKLLFADGSESIFLADLSGDGLTDLVRIRNGEVCYWPNLGYGRFGAKVTMDNAPRYEAQDLFDGRRIRLADIDGSGSTDILYFASGGVQLYFNQSGNGWGARRILAQFPPVESLSSATALDLLGNGTACLVWSSPLPGSAARPMRYIDLMGGQKPHLLVKVVNNLGAETRIQYAPSTKFYVADKLAGSPWVTRLPFPVQVVERVETLDWISRNRFVSRYAYHQGFYDGIEREFRGFGMVEQFDTEVFETGTAEGASGYDFTTVDFPGATSTFLQGLSNNGQIVGYQRDALGVLHSVVNGATFDPTGFSSTSFPGTSVAQGINDHGEVVGAVKKNDNPGQQAYYVKSGGPFHLYNHPNAGPSGVTTFSGINDAGVRVGSYSDSDSISHGIIQIGDTTAILEDQTDLPANVGAFVFDINNVTSGANPFGQMVGGYFDSSGDIQHGYLAEGTKFTTIDYPGSSTTWLNGINDLGQMVGAYFDDAKQRWQSFLTDGKTFTGLDFRDAQGMLHETFATGIDNGGRIVGYYGDDLSRLNKAGIHRFLATPVSGAVATSMPGGQQSSSPPTCTKTWFNTGVYFCAGAVSKHFIDEYYREGDDSDALAGLTSDQLEAMLLDDTVFPTSIMLPDGARIDYALTGDEMREAARALKGSILRQEVYALDGTDAADRPYTASERNYTIEMLQPEGPNRHAVFFVHARETIDFHYERKLFKVKDDLLADANNPPADAKDAADPRVTHTMTLLVDPFGNVLQSVAIGYGRRYRDPSLTLADQAKQSKTLLTVTESGYTNSIIEDDAYRVPLPCETRTDELINLTPAPPEPNTPDVTRLFRFEDLLTQIKSASAHDIPYENVDATGVPSHQRSRRIVEHLRTLYRPNDMGVAADDPSALLSLGVLQYLALPGISYKLAFTPGLLTQIYQRGSENLLPVPADVLAGVGPDQGGYVNLDGDGNWWVPSGRIFYHPEDGSTRQDAQRELDEARKHFFLPRRFEDPFGNSATVDYDAHDLLVARTVDAASNVVAADNDYRVLQPTLVTDPNENQATVSFDVLGLVAGTAVMGKTTDPVRDSLDAFVADLSDDQIGGFFAADDPHAPAPALLGAATTRIVYDVDRFRNSRIANPFDPTRWQPVFAATLARETHTNDPLPPEGLKIQISFSYSDGFGREIQKKIQSELGPISEGGPVVDPRWVGSGWTIFNNKGSPVRKYEPFFSQLPSRGHQFEFGVKVGVTPILCYDPVQRVVAAIHPNHTYEKVVFDPWRQETWDVNDTVKLDPKTDPDVGGFVSLLPDGDYQPSWYDERKNGDKGQDEKAAADKAAKHANTPALAHFDTLGRTFLTIADNGQDANGADQKCRTRIELDIEGNQREVIDALGRLVMRYDYDMLGARIHQASMEAGERWMLNDVTGKPIRAWNSRKYAFRTEYDQLRRPVRSFVQGGDPSEPNPKVMAEEILFERTIYGDSADTGLSDAQKKEVNLRTKIFKHFDCAGVVTSYGVDPTTKQPRAYDYKGNLLRSSRQFASDYKNTPDWSQNPALETEVFTGSTAYDALNRAIAVTTPDNSVYRPTFNEANLLEKVDVDLRGASASTSFVTNIDYNAKGQRTLIEYKNGAKTVFAYDEKTFRLVNLKTTRAPGQNGTAALIFNDPAVVQDLRYTYDPAGNITRIVDAALKTVFNNQQVDPSSDYIYDPLYRLTDAKAREHVGQSAFAFAPPDGNFRDYPFVGASVQNDLQQLRNYAEHYEYDPVGNFRTMAHLAGNGADNWTRDYQYNEASFLEPTKQNNQLSRTTLQTNGGSPAENYFYDAHGNMVSMPHLPVMQWDFKDQLSATSSQVVTGGTPETTYYVYDAAGQRARKVTERQNGKRKNERIYLGGFEIYREYGSGAAPTLERETLHVMDDKQRIALVETEVGSSAPVQRYQLANHLGSASLELDQTGELISYEEYSPYGNTTFQAGRSAPEVSLKRYRYTGKERDEENGFTYHGARYYAAWLGRWASCDPKTSTSSAYAYVSNSPTVMMDRNGREGEKGIIDKAASFAAGGLEQSWNLISGMVREKANSMARAAKEDPGLLVANPGLALAKVDVEKVYDAIKQEAEIQDPNRAAAFERWAVATNMVLNPAVGAAEHFPKMVEAIQGGDFRAAGAHYQQGAVSVVSTVLAATGAVEGGKAIGNAVKGRMGGSSSSVLEQPGPEPGPKPSPEPGPGPSPEPGAGPRRFNTERYTARAQEIKQAVVNIAGQKNAVVAVAPAIGPNGKPAVLVIGAGEASGKIGQGHLRAGEVLVDVPKKGLTEIKLKKWHAEIELMRYAKEHGYTLTEGVYPSDPFCETCAVQTRAAGLLPPDAAVSKRPAHIFEPYKTHDPIRRK